MNIIEKYPKKDSQTNINILKLNNLPLLSKRQFEASLHCCLDVKSYRMVEIFMMAFKEYGMDKEQRRTVATFCNYFLRRVVLSLPCTFQFIHSYEMFEILHIFKVNFDSCNMFSFNEELQFIEILRHRLNLFHDSNDPYLFVTFSFVNYFLSYFLNHITFTFTITNISHVCQIHDFYIINCNNLDSSEIDVDSNETSFIDSINESFEENPSNGSEENLSLYSCEAISEVVEENKSSTEKSSEDFTNDSREDFTNDSREDFTEDSKECFTEDLNNYLVKDMCEESFAYLNFYEIEDSEDELSLFSQNNLARRKFNRKRL